MMRNSYNLKASLHACSFNPALALTGLLPYPRRPGGEGEGVRSDLPHAISGTNDRIDPRETGFETPLRDLPKPYLIF